MRAFREPSPLPAAISMAVLGDSLAYGLGASRPENGLAHLLFGRVREIRPGSTYSNFGVPHSTVGDVLRHQVPQLHRSRATLVLLIAGANDLRYTRDSVVIARRFRKLLESVHDAAPQAAVVAAGMPDVSRTIALPSFLKPAAARLCRMINESMRKLTSEMGDEFIDLFTYTNTPLHPDQAYMCDDGYHPCDFGHAEIAERSFPALERAISSMTELERLEAPQ